METRPSQLPFQARPLTPNTINACLSQTHAAFSTCLSSSSLSPLLGALKFVPSVVGPLLWHLLILDANHRCLADC